MPKLSNNLNKPALKWVGGKRQLAALILELFPESFAEYHEPFVGSGSIALNVPAGHKINVSDLNPDLVLFWQLLQSQPKELILELSWLSEQLKNGILTFRDIKDAFNERSSIGIEHASYFVALVRLGHSGVWRVNQRGLYNVPSANYKAPDIVQSDLMNSTANNIRDWNIKHQSFEKISPAKGDLVYLDPPYHSLPETRSFTSYTAEGFPDSRQVDLRDWCQDLSDRGVKFIQSNSDCAEIRHLYRDFEILSVDRKGTINAHGSKRGRVGEVLVNNF